MLVFNVIVALVVVVAVGDGVIIDNDTLVINKTINAVLLLYVSSTEDHQRDLKDIKLFKIVVFAFAFFLNVDLCVLFIFFFLFYSPHFLVVPCLYF